MPWGLLCKDSPFFDIQLQTGRWPEGESGHVSLPDDDPIVFDDYLRWLYGTLIDVPYPCDGLATLAPLLKLYVFADKIQSIDCSEEIIRAIYEILHAIKNLDPESYLVVSELPEKNGLRLMILDWFTSSIELDCIKSDFCRENAEFMEIWAIHTILWRRDLAIAARSRPKLFGGKLKEQIRDVESYLARYVENAQN